jgi:3-deoxy-D-manno-octulosonate 8-phosphate phosphatase (KDO 8-P phosphatase)
MSGRESPVVARRMDALGVTHVYQGQDEKLPILRRLLGELTLPFESCAYVGDDVIDLPPMALAGLACAVADAHPAVRRAAHWVTRAGGGQGGAREVCDLILAAQDALPADWQPAP